MRRQARPSAVIRAAAAPRESGDAERAAGAGKATLTPGNILVFDARFEAEATLPTGRPTLGQATDFDCKFGVCGRPFVRT
jgi:hypothetical protein